MAITFRHDAAGVVPPSNQSQRKYGQSLVLQQQQQKYDSQQAGYDRMFDAYKMENQQQFQDKRDTKQVINQQLRDWQQQDFQKQQMEAARQQQFMDDARKLSSGMIMDDIKNGHYDPATAGKLRKNLVDEADALADKTLDATQRKKVLDAIRADRLLHTSNRMEKPPQPTATDRFNQRKHFDEESGQWFIENSKGDFVPVVDPRQQQQQEKLQQQQLQQQEQEAEKMRPKSAQDYYADPANDGKYEKDLDATMSRLDDERMSRMAANKDLKLPEVTEDEAWNDMQTRYDAKQKRLGKPQYGEPTLAPAMPGAPAGPQTQQERITELLKAEGMANPDAPKAESDPRIAEVLKREGMANPDEPKQNVDPKLLLQEAQIDNGTGRMPYGGFISNVPLDAAFFAPNVPQRGQPTPAAQKASQQGDASNYPWLRQPGQLMSENKAGQASSPITIETASVAAKQYEAASQQLQTLQSQSAVMDANIRSLQGRTGRSGVRSTQTNQEIARLKKERQQLNLGIRSAQNTMQASDKSVRGYYDQEVAKQPAVQTLAKAGKRPQDFAQAEFQLKNLRMQYPDMSTMPAEAKKQLKEAMAIIQAGR